MKLGHLKVKAYLNCLLHCRSRMGNGKPAPPEDLTGTTNSTAIFSFLFSPKSTGGVLWWVGQGKWSVQRTKSSCRCTALISFCRRCSGSSQKQFLHYLLQRKSTTVKAVVPSCTAKGATSSLPERRVVRALQGQKSHSTTLPLKTVRNLPEWSDCHSQTKH